MTVDVFGLVATQARARWVTVHWSSGKIRYWKHSMFLFEDEYGTRSQTFFRKLGEFFDLANILLAFRWGETGPVCVKLRSFLDIEPGALWNAVIILRRDQNSANGIAGWIIYLARQEALCENGECSCAITIYAIKGSWGERSTIKSSPILR